MTEADRHFKETCKRILEEGYSSEGTGVRTRWEDGTEANYISIVGVQNVYDVGKEFPMITLRNNSQTVKRAIDEILWIWQKKSNKVSELNSHIWDQWAFQSCRTKRYELRTMCIFYTMVSKRWKTSSYFKSTFTRYVSCKWLEHNAICSIIMYVCTSFRIRSWHINT